VNIKLELTLGELKSKFRSVTRRMVLECGGNGRSFFNPQARGNQWTNGGAGCAEWTGVRLADVLKAAGVKPSAVFTGHYGADPHLSGDHSRVALSRDVPIKKAMDKNNLIVWAMNGEPLALIHGFPVRLVIGGWPGSVSEKWLTRIWVRDKPHDGQGMGAPRTASRPGPSCPAAMTTGRHSAISNRCRCARSLPIRPTAPSSPPASRNSDCAAPPGQATTR
jgi:DMSO/TMAO reductase YedYZ molybdopterin-dependent catalytic subunit